MAERWYSAHVHYYEPDKDALLLDAVGPLLERLDGAVHGAHVLRHWRLGPHLRINLRTEPQTWTRQVRPAIEEVVGGYLRAYPSTARIDTDRALAQHRLLAEREQENGPLTPWAPDNTITYPHYDSRAQVLGSRGAELLAGFYADSTRPLLEMLGHVRAGRDDKEALALSLMLATSHTVLGPITRSYVSYRSHAEGFIVQCSDPGAVRAAFDDRYEQRRRELTARVRTVVSALDGGGSGADGAAREPAPFAAQWAALVSRYAERARPLVDRGLLITPGNVEDIRANPRLSDFHRTMFATRAYHERYLSDPAFLVYRVLLNYTYLHLTRLGMAPPERMRTCHLAANAVEEVYGLSAVAMMERFTAAHLAEEGNA
ncbi:hypothetical protein GCM10027570_08800 [Streptomonospora sediminis]